MVSFEQPGYAEFETFPDNTTQIGHVNVTNGNVLDVLMQDISLIPDIFNITSNSSKLRCGARAAVFGHSEGGAVTAASVLAASYRLLGGINLDVAFYGSPLNANASMSQPFAIFSSSTHNQLTSPTWPVVWEHLKADKWQIQLHDSQHATYGDCPYLADLWGIRKRTGGSVDELVGGIAGTEAIEVVSELVKAFFDVVFGKEPVRDLFGRRRWEGSGRCRT